MAKTYETIISNVVAIITIIISLLILLDFVVTKLDVLPLKVKLSGIEHLGFSEKLAVFGKSVASSNERQLRIAFLGDSHHTFNQSTVELHQSEVLHDSLKRNGVSNHVYSLGTPRYSLIQELVALEKLVNSDRTIDVAIFLLYAGNDFSELLRNDDRPFVTVNEAGVGLIKEPDWLLERVKDKKYNKWPRDSRLLYLINQMIPHNIVLKVIASQKTLNIFEPTIAQRVNYLWFLKKSIDNRFSYPGAVPSQFLNQYYLYSHYEQLFREEVKWRLRHFFSELKKRFPNTKTYIFYLPSAIATEAISASQQEIISDVVRRNSMEATNFLNIENGLYHLLQVAKREERSNVKIYDLTPLLNEKFKRSTLNSYYDDTLHIHKEARAIIGEYIADVLLQDAGTISEKN